MRLLKIIGKRFSRNRLSVIGAVTVLLLITISLLAPFIAPYDPTAIDVRHTLSPPSKTHLLGTDELGRDLLSRIIWGSRVSLKVGFVAVGIAIVIGIIIGAIAGFYGGKVDAILMRFVDIMLAFPTFFLILAVISILEPNIFTIMAVIGITSWMDVARLVRAEFLSLKERDFVGAARAVGVSDTRLIFRHILPNALSPVFVAATFGVAGAILIESGLSFLGLGVQPPDPSWGNILTSGKDNIEVAWWLSLYPGLAILITVLSYNLVGEGLRDALDPRIWEAERR
ncbi:MAG: peptide ABC transporter permease [Nitrospirae bacterium CG_4_10_14_0_8_um_filter_41_23]|nr:ABC transporter permease [Nitrospirota bacterium]PIQ94968.1 MAG: peptide ABC transporter permease [Nitrospirae bacterium CG11_big_fil_rev_8_21_14_0_20_41_14]PIV41516.1 MAG: peptide ABC transporter permease [Nitrospirae bacterium CG02_land_8_20_14_3_00_41_53]PIW87861.1 MAG: peptide ABC transporter permease [Nitrospirae bacterium CG_4_8_14_3_um_filter_41_47]PIY86169.1 MAG: peptide ABC transporter permease [Nitrospirae bacterium CG_4_10_14_0_8_um_filter_41_23]PJA80951.1 MAG: peptide ABC transp